MVHAMVAPCHLDSGIPVQVLSIRHPEMTIPYVWSCNVRQLWSVYSVRDATAAGLHDTSLPAVKL